MLLNAPIINKRVTFTSQRVIVCKCNKDGRRGRMMYDFRSNSYIYEGCCYEFHLCAIVMRFKFETWIKRNEKLIENRTNCSRE